MTELASRFTEFMSGQRAAGNVVVQPRMGLCAPDRMAAGLRAVRDLDAPTVGTLTLDSYTRQNQHERARMAVQAGVDLNGYPLTTVGADATSRMLDGIIGPDFPIQVRHGSPDPEEIFRVMLAAGIDASEGGPVSYCIPYSRMPLRVSTQAWVRSVRMLARCREQGVRCHLESFGGCMLGQLCPPSLLVALSVLECLFFVEHGVVSVSASYAQQTNPDQDAEALVALRRLCAEHLADADWHIVLYTFMGLFPESAEGGRQLLDESVDLAVRTPTDRLIVKTTAEAYRIPTVEENIEALRTAHLITRRPVARHVPETADSEIYAQASRMVQVVRGLTPTITESLPEAFARGLLDVPYCLHPDNRSRTRSVITSDGRLEWWDTGNLPLPAGLGGRHPSHRGGAAQLTHDLTYHRRRLDAKTAHLRRSPVTRAEAK